jgi:uncharacterized protein YecA (UPF0149 family)
MSRANYQYADDPVAETGNMAAALLADQGTAVAPTAQPMLPQEQVGNGAGQRRQQPPADPDALVPVVKAPSEKIGRNDPCWCGSGRKYKMCHGAA